MNNFAPYFALAPVHSLTPGVSGKYNINVVVLGPPRKENDRKSWVPVSCRHYQSVFGDMRVYVDDLIGAE